MYHNDDEEAQEIEAINLIDQAENSADANKGDDAIRLYEKAAQIYLDLGKYIKLDELFARIIQIISQFKNHIQAVYRLESIIRKTEELKLYEISAKLLSQLGNLSFKMRDWETAGDSWNKAANYLFKSDPEYYHSTASRYLLEAGQAYERSHLTKDLGKQLILKAVMIYNKFDELFQQEEKKAQLLLINEEFEAAANKFHEISTYFSKALDNLPEVLEGIESQDIVLNTKARFIHFIAEYQAVSALCLAASKNPDFKEKIEHLGSDSIKHFKESISLLKSYLYPIKTDFDREIVLRVTFDTMLLTLIQRIISFEEVKGTEYLLNNIEDNKSLLKEIKKSPYFKISTKIEKVGLTEALDDLLKVNLGHFEKIKNTIVSHFL